MNKREAKLFKSDKENMREHLCRLVESFEILSAKVRRDGLAAVSGLPDGDAFKPGHPNIIKKGHSLVVNGIDSDLLEKLLKSELIYYSAYSKAVAAGFIAINSGKKTFEVVEAMLGSMPLKLQREVRNQLANRGGITKEERIFGMTKGEIADLVDELSKQDAGFSDEESNSKDGKGWIEYAESMQRGHAAMMKNWLHSRNGKQKE